MAFQNVFLRSVILASGSCAHCQEVQAATSRMYEEAWRATCAKAALNNNFTTIHTQRFKVGVYLHR